MKSHLLFVSLLVVFTLTTACATQPIKAKSDEGKEAQLMTYQTDSNGFDTKNYFYDNGEEIVVFDAHFTPEYARKSIAAIRAKSKSPIKYLVITHPNPDKFNGMKVFQDFLSKSEM